MPSHKPGGAAIPIGTAQARQGRHEHQTALDRGAVEGIDLGEVLEQAEFRAQFTAEAAL